MISLEGKNAWMLNLLPIQRSQLLWGKFAFSVSLSFLTSELLLIISDIQLGVIPELIFAHAILMAIVSIGLSAISVGLGAKLPNYRESDPSKIAAGFGGTLNLVISLMFLLITIGMLALPCHLYFLGMDSSAGFRRIGYRISQTDFYFWLTMALLFNGFLCFLAIFIPIRLGLKALNQQEF
jgi:ABC-2 type transport system permease protein